MSGKNIQLCDECNEPTGAAGAEDELNFEATNGDKFGPLCSQCYERLVEMQLNGKQPK